ncbi:SLBB domain-containing protein [Prevotella sp. E9-3]|uniref:SLBB domain-containing protein n=1 Tax=Prevotella sp. E9-3 TaxID=2913621 RepID=UPI001EDC05E8|nr:SLBB domain-containing protein [Prevotella sp. E9-3]UKK49263.1 SLBB domain-containing protein [Prevotella sp. E9-3]
MKRFTTFILCALITTSASWAQSAMTDQQIYEFALEKYSQGMQPRQIAIQLAERGVTTEQMQRVYSKYKDQASQTGGSEISAKTVQRARHSNGEKREDAAADNFPGSSNKMPQGATLEEFTQQLFMPETENGKSGWREIFGHDVFNNKNLTFESSMNLATPQNYTLGPGDVVNIDIWGASQKSFNETISPDGTITISEWGVISLGGLTVDKAKNKIRRELGAHYESSQIDLTLGQTRSITISVMGEVLVPGTYTMSAFATVYNALYMAGGPNEIGTLRNVKIYRKGHLISTVDVYDFLLNGKLSGEVRLEDNDIITVSPYEALVLIEGKVKRPMYYEMKKGETAATIIQYAGGFTGDAYTKAISVKRKTEPQLSVFSIGEFDLSQFKLMDEDVISIGATLNRYQNMVQVKGAVFRPGMYQIGNNITTVKTLVEAAAGLTEGAIAQHAILERLNADRTLKIVSVNISGILNGTVADVPLCNEDVLIIGSNDKRNNNRTVTIHGEVLNPGKYKYADDETIEDLIIRAGGPTEAATYKKIDVARRVVDPEATASPDSITENYTFSFNPDFTIEGSADFTLKPYDQVYVRRNPSYNIQQNVYVDGEVEFEGTYTLTSKKQHLSEVLKMAGGPTKFAYLQGAKLLRRMTEEEKMVAENVLRTAQRNTSTDSIDIKKLMLQPNYPIAFELDKALKNPGTTDDPILRDGDRIIIPRLTSTVTINGEVLFPNSVRYKEGLSAKDYIKLAGGYTSTAKKSKSIIIYMNGMVAKANSHNKPMPGCQIVVPTKKKGHRLSTGEILSIATTTASLGTMAATIANLTK